MSGWYRSVTGALEPVAPVVLRWKTRDPESRRERLGQAAVTPGAVWWHAASLGEVTALVPILAAMEHTRPDLASAVTTTSETGRARARSLVGERASLAPLDLPRAVRRAWTARQPVALVLVETELWPNLLREATRRGVPTAMVNARISDRSWPRYRRLRRVVAPLLAAMHAVAARTGEDAERLLALGAPAARTRVTGNTKYDRLGELPEPLDLPWSGGRVITAGSVHGDESDTVLRALAAVRAQAPETHCILAPRHLDRGVDWAVRIRAAGLSLARRTAPGEQDAKADVLLLDTHGELVRADAASAAAFVGGTLNPVGGHNPLEASACGIPVVVGTSVRNIREEIEGLRAAGGAVQVDSSAALARTIIQWVENPEAARHAGIAGRALVDASRGASERTVTWLTEQGVFPETP